MKQHNVIDDPTTQGYPRKTCTHCQCQVVRQPYMSDLEWKIALERFQSAHGGCSCGSMSGAHKSGCPMCPSKYA